MDEPKSYLPWYDCDLSSLPCYCSCHFLHGTTFPFLLKSQTLCFKAHHLPNFASASTFHPQSAFLVPWPVVSYQDLHSHGVYLIITGFTTSSGFAGGKVIKNPPAKAGDPGSIPGSGSSPGGGHANSLQCSCLENTMDKRAWQAAVHRVTKSCMRLSDWACTGFFV